MRKGIILFLFLFIILISLPANSADWTEKDITTFVGYSGKQVVITWDSANRATSYVLRIKHIERDSYLNPITTTETQYTFTVPRTGHYVVEIKSVNEYGESPWSASDSLNTYTDPGLKPFWIYGYTEPAGPIIIGSDKSDKPL